MVGVLTLCKGMRRLRGVELGSSAAFSAFAKQFVGERSASTRADSLFVPLDRPDMLGASRDDELAVMSGGSIWWSTPVVNPPGKK